MTSVPMPASPLERAELQQRANDRLKAHLEAACARHGCGHLGADHLAVESECGRCGCPAFLEAGACDAGELIIINAPSGVRYERCRCGAARAIAPGAEMAAWTWPDDV